MPESLNLDETLRRKDFDDPDELAEIVKALTRNVAEVVPGDMLIRQPELPAEVQRERGQRIMAILDEEADKAREILVQRKLTGLFREYLDAVDKGDYDEITAAERKLSPYNSIELTKHAWPDAIAAALVKGWPVEVEPGPVGGVWHRGAMKIEAHGLGIVRVLRRVMPVMPNLRIVSFIEDDVYAYGAVKRDLFVVKAAQLLHTAGVVQQADVPGRDFALLRKSDQPARYEAMMQRLAEAGHGVLRRQGGVSNFLLPRRPGYEHHTHEACASCRFSVELNEESLGIFAHAFSFMNLAQADINRPLLHVTLAGNPNLERMLLRSADLISEERWHNLRVGPSEKTEKVANYAFCRLMSIEIGRYLNSLNKYNDWHEMDSYEYAERNFLHIHDEDRELIPKAVRALGQIGLQPETAEQTVDVGPGPNLYSAMLAAPFAKGPIVLREFSPSNRGFLQSLLDGTIEPKFNQEMWPQFEELMVEAGGELYRGVMDKALEKSQVEAGSIYDLPREKFDWVSAFCVLESIVDNKLAFWQLWKIVGQSLRKPNPEDPKDRGGIFVGAFMVGSEGWPAGSAHFPAVNLSLEQMEAACRDANLEFLSLPIGEDENTQRMREGYQGMALIIAWRRHHQPTDQTLPPVVYDRRLVYERRQIEDGDIASS